MNAKKLPLPPPYFKNWHENLSNKNKSIMLRIQFLTQSHYINEYFGNCQTLDKVFNNVACYIDTSIISPLQLITKMPKQIVILLG